MNGDCMAAGLGLLIHLLFPELEVLLKRQSGLPSRYPLHRRGPELRCRRNPEENVSNSLRIWSLEAVKQGTDSLHVTVSVL